MSRPVQQSLGEDFGHRLWAPVEGPEQPAAVAPEPAPVEAAEVPADVAPAVDVAPWWGNKRPYGVRAQDWEQIKRHREQSAVTTAQFERDRAAGSLKPIEVSVCCTCNFLPYPHLVQSFDDERRYRHSKGSSK